MAVAIYVHVQYVCYPIHYKILRDKFRKLYFGVFNTQNTPPPGSTYAGSFLGDRSSCQRGLWSVRPDDAEICMVFEDFCDAITAPDGVYHCTKSTIFQDTGFSCRLHVLVYKSHAGQVAACFWTRQARIECESRVAANSGRTVPTRLISLERSLLCVKCTLCSATGGGIEARASSSSNNCCSVVAVETKIEQAMVSINLAVDDLRSSRMLSSHLFTVLAYHATVWSR